MSGEASAESAREVVALATLQNRRSKQLSRAVYVGFFGTFVFGLIGGSFYSLSVGIAWGFWAVGVGCLAASIFSAALNSGQHKKCAVTSRAMIEIARTQNDSNTMEPLQEGEFMGRYEVLCSDESMVMMSRDGSLVSSILIRAMLLLIGIAIFGAIAAMIYYGGTKLFLQLKGVLFLGIAGLSALFFAMRRSPLRWYASREELIIRIETIRWIFVREIEDVAVEQIEVVFLDTDSTIVQTTDGKTRFLQHIGIPEPIGVKLSKDEQAAAEASIRQLQHTRILKSLDQVFPSYFVDTLPQLRMSFAFSQSGILTDRDT